MRYARVDDNQTEIVSALRQAGCSVQSLASVGHGVPDLLVARNGMMWLVEVKNYKQPPSKQRLTPDEKEWRDTWKAPVYTVHNVDEAMFVIRRYER